ncbi:MAG TPA: DUF998 domain-containing protein [Cytophagales bacterium]|nr:DUF998 domain-containing protein [Cytophagales bacterium]
MANTTIVFGLISILSILTLHVVSPEFKPSFRMVSEYALGKYKWLLMIFFISWGLSTIAAGFMLWDIVNTGWAKFGVGLLFVTGIGAIMGGLFDVQHKLHGLAFGIGIPFLPIAALIITYHLLKRAEWQSHSTLLLFSSHAVWISLVCMAGSMFLLFSSLKSAGIAFGPDAPPLSVLPKGVIGINGWANRFLVFAYILYPVLIAKVVLTMVALKN